MDVAKIVISDNAGKKRAKAEFFNKEGKKIKTTAFGMEGSKGTFYDGATEEKKKNYIGRHEKREDWTKSGLMTAGFLSRWVLWSERTNAKIKKLISDISGIPVRNIKINLSRIRVSD